MDKYDHKAVEAKQQKKWWDADIDKVGTDPNKPKCYVLDMFPYPSGEGLHVGHPKGYIATDIYSRLKKMQGHNILHPMGWDAFGLPAENYALKNKIHPKVAVDKNIATFKEQLKKIGFNYDWEKEINTTDPEYYRWTQWIFLKMFEKGLAYESHEPINWCPSCQTGLANEDLDGGKCERCGSEVERRPMRQWVLKITDYADRLLSDLDATTYIRPIIMDDKNPHETGKPVVSRDVAHAIVFDPKTKKYLIIRNKKHNWDTVIIGGIEAGENAVETARREVKEETGYSNLEFKRILGGPTEAHYYAKHKGENRIAIATAVYFELKSEERVAIAEGEDKDDEVIWVAKEDFVPGKMVNSELPIWLERLADATVGQMVPILNWPESIKTSQKNWIGRSEGLLFTSPVKDTDLKIKTFSAHFEAFKADTFVVIAPDHPFLPTLVAGIPNEQEVLNFAKQLVDKRADQGYDGPKEPEGIFTGRYTIDPVGNGELPIWVANYALADYGTGIVKCSAHDERDFAFAKKYTIPLKVVLVPEDEDLRKKVEAQEICFTDMKNGRLLEPDKFEGQKASLVRKEVIDHCLKNNLAEKKVTYKLKDWVFSRQRYWGEPIPLIHCPSCAKASQGKANAGVIAVPYDQLPVVLPEVEHYEPTGTGESPLASITDWVNVTCPTCGEPGKRETNTMPQWAGSCWYYLAYACKNPKIKGEPPRYDLLNKEKLDYWNPVDFYVGGTEHATRHLIYARFWHKFLYDIGIVNNSEPFVSLRNQGLVLASDGRKMSKRFGNVINPDEIIELYGADSLRLYEMFMGPFSDEIAWSTDNIIGVRRFLERVWRLEEKVAENGLVDESLNLTIKKVTEDILNFRFNTAISSMMIQTNTWDKAEKINKNDYQTLLKLLAPFAPHITDQLWEKLGQQDSIHLATWPTYDITQITPHTVTVVIQVNGKVRGRLVLAPGLDEEAVKALALADETTAKWVKAEEVKEIIYVPDRVVNFMV